MEFVYHVQVQVPTRRDGRWRTSFGKNVEHMSNDLVYGKWKARFSSPHRGTKDWGAHRLTIAK